MLQKIKLTIIDELKKGLTVEKIASTLSIGILIGVFPLLGTTTLLAFIIGKRLNLNQPILQAINYLMYPAQIVLVPIYLKIAIFFTKRNDIPIMPNEIAKLFLKDSISFIKNYSFIGLIEILIWIIFSIPLYFLLKKIFLKVLTKQF